MIPVLLIGIPLLAGLIGFSLKDAAAKSWSLFASLLTLVVSAGRHLHCLPGQQPASI